MAGNSTKVVLVAFIMNMGIAVAKYVGFMFSGSAAMLAEAVHSLADTSNQIFLFLGLRRSQKAASATHPFGYGMEQYIFSFLVALLIFTLGGAYSLYEGIHKILHPSESIPHVLVNVIILAVAICMEGYSSFIATRELKKTKGSYSFFQYLRRTKDQILVTVIFEDYAALIGLVVALAGILGYMITGLVIFDSIATILIGVLLILIAVFLYREAKSLLLGEAASPEDQEKIQAAFSANPNVESVKELLTMHLSPYQILVTAHVKFRKGISLEEVEKTIDAIEDTIVEQVPEVYKIFIETHQKTSVQELQGAHPRHNDTEADKANTKKKTMIGRGGTKSTPQDDPTH